MIYVHQGYIYLITNTVILWNIITIEKKKYLF